MFLFKTIANKKKMYSVVDKGVIKDRYLIYVYVYSEMFFPNRLSCKKANDKLA